MGVLEAILAVFTSVATWLASTFPALEPIFWTAGTGGTSGQLTFMGVLACSGLAIGVVLLLLGIIQRFMRFGS